MSVTNSHTAKKPRISWEQDFETSAYCCKVWVPYSWLIETSAFERRLKLWWWLTKLSWTLPK